MKPRYFFIIAGIAVGIGLAGVAVHQEHATNLTTALLKRDTSGFDTTSDQHQLSSYIRQHMGVTQTVYLAGAYGRALQAAQAAANPASNGMIYVQAQAACASHADSVTQANCVQAYLSSHAQPSANPQAVAMPSKATYT